MKVFMADLFGTDQYPRWEEAVRDAINDVLIVSPFFDELVVRLVTACRAGSSVRVLTNLSPPREGGTSWFRQVEAAQQLLARGVDVRSLSRLHAKVLLVDGGIVSVGSQNFTTYGRRSKEASARTSIDDKRGRLHQSIERWWSEAEKVNEGMLERLLLDLASQVERLESESEAAERAFRESIRQYQLELEQRRKEQLDAQIKRKLASSKFRFAGGSIDCQVRYANWDSLQKSLIVSEPHFDDLTQWPKGEVRRLHQLPFLNTETNGMAFARVAKTRITFLSPAVHRTQQSQLFKPGSISVHLNTTGRAQNNVLVSLACGSSIGIAISPGSEMFTSTVKRGSPYAAQIEGVLASPKKQKQLLGEALGSFMFDSPLSGSFEPIENFLRGKMNWRVNRIDVRGHPILIAQ